MLLDVNAQGPSILQMETLKPDGPSCWTVAGSVKCVPTSTSACLHAVPVKDGSLEFIQWFCVLEAVPGDDSNLTAINLRIMDYFEETTTKDKDRRYHISFPRKDPAPTLGESRFTSLRRYKQN